MADRALQKIERIRKMLQYVLGRAPDEFGLVTDDDGFVSFKSLRQGIVEEDGWGFLGLSSIREVLLHDRGEHFEVNNDNIRCIERTDRVASRPIVEPGKILYVAIRNRAWPHVAEKGLKPFSGPWVVLAREKEMAVRIGKRRDGHPILLEVHTGQARSRGVQFYAAGEELVLADFVPADVIIGPPVKKKEDEPAKKPPKPAREKDKPGSFFLDAERDLETPERKGSKRKREKDERRHGHDKRGRRAARKWKTGKDS